MLLNFKVKNFRSIKDEIILDLQATSDKTMESQAVFELGKVSLLKTAAIYGPNASGKSNILKAFVAFRAMVLESFLRSNLTVELPNEYFKLSSDTENKPSSFEMTFLLNKEIFMYGFEFDKKKIFKEWLRQKKGNKILFERNGQKIESNKNYFQEASMTLKNQTSERVLFLTLLASNNGAISKQVMQFIQKVNFVSATQRGATLDFSFIQFSNNLDMAKQMKDFTVMADFGVVDIIADEKMVLAKDIHNMPDKFKELIFSGQSEIAQRNLQFLHKKFNAKGEEISSESLDFIAEESEGTQQWFALSAPILDTLNEGKVLLVDEIDASLHPILTQYLITIFNSKEKNPHNAQLIFTTHNISLLKEDILRRDQIYFTDKNKVGATDLFSLADISERKGVDFAKRYLEGRYNALPFISDFENLKNSK